MPQKITVDSKTLLKKQNLKLRNQIAHLDSLLRKKESLQIEINRMRKLIQLNQRKTKESLKESFPDSVLENGNLFLPEELTDSELSTLAAEFTSLEEDYDFLINEFS